ncbi:MAG: MoaD/ThiS family protein [Candidatus Hodarchaeaceae archaeon]|nr:MoaD/ThiS family protein [Candidatus Hodarchaeaceae archaeon]
MPTLRRLRKERKFDLELPANATVRTVLAKLGFKEDEMEHLRIFINNEWARLNKALKDGDAIWVGVIVGGG